ncbi:hypothetical protein Tco_0569700 [Tanacetum coccineum]
MFRVDRIENRGSCLGMQVAQLVIGELRAELECSIPGHIARNYTYLKRPQNSEYFKDKMLLMQAQDNGVALDEEQLLFIAGGQDNAIDEDMDEKPVQDLTLNVDNVFQADDSGLSLCSGHSIEDTITMIPIRMLFYVKDNAVPVVQSDVSSIPNDAYMMIFNDMHEPHAQSVSDTTRNTVVDNSLTAELATYKEQVELYEDGARLKYGGKRTRWLTKGERGFEQTKECYLTEVIPFFKTLKEHFERIQKALTKEIKEMKDIFEEMEAEVDQNVINRKHDEIEQKNLLIANDNLIVDCLSKEVFYIATNYELTVSRVTEMHEAHTIVQTRCLELEAMIILN